jgi:Ni/Co efflux regulator RcnB
MISSAAGSNPADPVGLPGSAARRNAMAYRIGDSLPVALALLLLSGGATAAFAQQQQPPQHEEHARHPAAAAQRAAPRPAPRAAAAASRGEHYSGPQRYQGVAAPKGWNAQPKTFDRSAYQHNFQAPRNYRIGPYRRPRGWVARRWGYGQILPRAFWVPQYVIADYWLFGLEVPPVGYAWVRYGDDALLINMTNGMILQAEYGVFA